MSIYTAFSESILRRLHFVDRFRSLAGIESSSTAVVSSFLENADIDEWILEEQHHGLKQTLSSIDDTLVKLVFSQTQKWAQQFAVRLTERPPNLGEVISTRLLDSDPHSSGILIDVEFATGHFVYKPRSVKIDLAYNNITKKLSESGLEFSPRSIEIIDCEDYGYIEYVIPRRGPIILRNDEIRNLGAILAITYVLAGKDFHYENVIFSEAGPATLIDLEGMLQPDLLGQESKKANHISVLRTGILPARLSVGSFDFDPSIIGSKLYGLGEKFSEAASEFVTGFKSTYMHILNNKNIFQDELRGRLLSDSHTRFIVSSTLDYYRAISRFIYYESTGRGATFTDGIRSSSAVDAVFLEHERLAISRLCVPVFLSKNSGNVIIAEDDTVIAVPVRASGLQKATQRLAKQMSLDDLERQTWFIWMSLELHAKNNGIECDVRDQNFDVLNNSSTRLERSASNELNRMLTLMKMQTSGSHIIVFPEIEDGSWVLKDRNMDLEEAALWQSVSGMIRNVGKYEANSRRDELATVVRALQTLSRVDRCGWWEDGCEGQFMISAWCGPCAELFEAFLRNEATSDAHGAAFIAFYNEAAGRRAIVYPGQLQSRSLVFASGMMSLVVAMLVAGLLAKEAELAP